MKAGVRVSGWVRDRGLAWLCDEQVRRSIGELHWQRDESVDSTLVTTPMSERVVGGLRVVLAAWGCWTCALHYAPANCTSTSRSPMAHSRYSSDTPSSCFSAQ